MQVFIAQVINGLSLGSIYVLLVTGFNLLLLVAMIIHFSYPQVVVFSMYITWVVLRLTGNNLVLGDPRGRRLLDPAQPRLRAPVPEGDEEAGRGGHQQHHGPLHGHRDDHHRRPLPHLQQRPSHRVSRVARRQRADPPHRPDQPSPRAGLVPGRRDRRGVRVLSPAVPHAPGRAFRAIAEDPNGARLVGIPLLRTGLYSYALSGVLGGIIAVLFAMLLGSASPGLGEQVAHKVLAVSIIAGLGNLVGGLVVGLVLGILEAIVQGYISGSWSNAIAFVIMLVVILVRPKGLFGTKL